jgi:branched-subunit amino acid transport protein AzlD
MSVGVIENAGVACSGVTACDQTKSVAAAIAIAHVEKNILRIVAFFVFANSRNDNDLVTFQKFGLASQKWLHCKIFGFVRVVPMKFIQNARPSGFVGTHGKKQPHRSVRSLKA